MYYSGGCYAASPKKHPPTSIPRSIPKKRPLKASPKNHLQRAFPKKHSTRSIQDQVPGCIVGKQCQSAAQIISQMLKHFAARQAVLDAAPDDKLRKEVSCAGTGSP